MKERKKQPAAVSRTIESKPNRTGIPDNVKAGFENYSGKSFDDVRVHYNSDVPAQFQAHALTIGNQVHIAPGQERHRDHELGHVVQQKRGEVRPDSKVNGMNANTNESMEKGADNIAAGVTVQRKAWIISRELHLGASGSSDSDSSSSRAQHVGRRRGSSHGSSDSSHGASISAGALASSAGPAISSNESSRSEGSSQEGRGSGSSASSSPGGSKGSTSRGNLPHTGVTDPADASELITDGDGAPAELLDISQTTETSGDRTSYSYRMANLKYHHRHILFSGTHQLPTGTSNNIGWGGTEYSESALHGYQLNQEISGTDEQDERLVDTVHMDKYQNYGKYNIFVRNCQHWVNDVVRSFRNDEAPHREQQGPPDAQQPAPQEEEPPPPMLQPVQAFAYTRDTVQRSPLPGILRLISTAGSLIPSIGASFVPAGLANWSYVMSILSGSIDVLSSGADVVNTLTTSRRKIPSGSDLKVTNCSGHVDGGRNTGNDTHGGSHSLTVDVDGDTSITNEEHPFETEGFGNRVARALAPLSTAGGGAAGVVNTAFFPNSDRLSGASAQGYVSGNIEAAFRNASGLLCRLGSCCRKSNHASEASLAEESSSSSSSQPSSSSNIMSEYESVINEEDTPPIPQLIPELLQEPTEA